ncbi:hypothetical protein AAG906_008966 [Vitis piasezkii]
MVTVLPQISIPSQVCEGCVVGKQHRSQFPQGHQEQRMSWNRKIEAFSAFKSFKACVKKKQEIHQILLIVVENIVQMNLNIFVMIKAYKENSQCLYTAIECIHVLNKSYIFCSKHDTGGGLEWTKPAVDHFKILKKGELLQQQIPTVSIPESPPNDAPTAETSSTAAESNVVVESRLRRVRKRPAWMQDFELNKDGGVDKYKARLVVKGYKQEFGVDYKEVFAPEQSLTLFAWCYPWLPKTHVQSSAGVFISQKKYALEILDKFMLKDCNSVITPSEVGLKLSKSGAERGWIVLLQAIVGSLIYMENPTEVHLWLQKNFHYLKGKTLGFYTKGDYAGDLDDRKSTSGAVFMLNSGAITWSSKKQQIVTLSTTEAEFVAAASSSCQAIWLRRLLEVLYNQQQGPTVIYCDNLSAIKLSKNLVLHGRSKHIDVRYHFLRDLCKDGVIDLVFCKSEDQIADILTKPLKPAVFMKLRSMLGVCSSKEVVAASGKALQIDS